MFSAKQYGKKSFVYVIKFQLRKLTKQGQKDQ